MPESSKHSYFHTTLSYRLLTLFEYKLQLAVFVFSAPQLDAVSVGLQGSRFKNLAGPENSSKLSQPVTYPIGSRLSTAIHSNDTNLCYTCSTVLVVTQQLQSLIQLDRAVYQITAQF
ncbi:hypothetical protein NXS19_007466 [Fusarium pseudograminearum]|nr:hypothetical protein NXS19_007466 [Fusarium pseudograminearum]